MFPRLLHHTVTLLQKQVRNTENRSYLLLGNLANFFLDELLFAHDPEEVSFDETFLKSFRQSPFEYTSCRDIASDENFREFMRQARAQFENIKRVITRDFPEWDRSSQMHARTVILQRKIWGFRGVSTCCIPTGRDTVSWN